MFNSKTAPPIMEALEPRLFLDGAVDVQVLKGVLTITGDDQANSIVVTQSGFGQYVVKDTVNGTTLINGVLGGNNTPFACNGAVKIDLKGGANQLAMETVIVGRTVFGSIVQSDLSITTGAGNDTIDLVSVVARRLTLNAGDGSNDSRVKMLVGGVRPHFTGNVSIKGGTGSDVVVLYGVLVGGNVTVSPGDGSNEFWLVTPPAVSVSPRIIGQVTYTGGSGTDLMAVRGVSFTDRANIGGVVINTKASASTIELTDLDCHGAVKFQGGDQVDQLTFTDAIFSGVVDIQTKGGNDTVRADDSEFERAVKLNLGANDDTLLIETLDKLVTDVAFHGLLTVDFGTGNDSGEIGDDSSSLLEAAVFYAPATFKGGAGTHTLVCLPSGTRFNVFNEVTFTAITTS